jgi:serine O-acetyltransferase
LVHAQNSGKKSRSAEKAAGRWDLDDTVDALRHSREVAHNIRHGGVARRVPSRTAIAEVINGISAALFPTHYGQPNLEPDGTDVFVRAKLKESLGILIEQTRLSLPLAASEDQFEIDSAGRVAQDIVQEFAAQLPGIRAQLADDLRAAHEGDSGAASIPEILLGHPSVVAIICYRLARALHLLGAPLVARLMTLVAHSRTGIDIHPGAEIGAGFSIDHGTGVVIGETAIIGKHVRLSQAVTLGAMRSAAGARALALRGVARHPILEDDVLVHAGATLLGRITIGKGSVVGGNVWLTRSVPPGSNIVQPQLRGLGSDGDQK